MPKRVLVIDSIATHRIRLSALLEDARFQVVAATDMTEFKGSARDFDLVILGLPRHRPAGQISSVAGALQGARIPILALDGSSSPLRRLLALRAGAREILRRQVPDDLLLSRLRGLIREGEAEREADRRRLTAASFGFAEANAGFDAKASILCLGSLGSLPSELSALLPHKVTTADAVRGADGAWAAKPDAIVLNTGSDGRALTSLLSELRDETHLSPAPVLALYPERRPSMATQALALGASEVVPDSAGIEEVELRLANMLDRKAQNDALRRSDEQSYRLAATDPLTGLYNRRYAETYLAALPSQTDAQHPEFCVLLVDLDHFKAVNDTHGHVAGDRVLQEVAQRLQDNLRACDLIARYGGEEFLVVLPETSAATASLLAERLRCAIAARDVVWPGGPPISVSVSIGVAAGSLTRHITGQRTGTCDMAGVFSSDFFQTTFEAADAALYQAKTNGRNRVEVSAASAL